MNKAALQLLEYDLTAGVRAFSTLREGGVSESNYASFNVAPYCGDQPEHVEENKRRLAEGLAIETEKIILPHQTHSDRCKCIGADYFDLTQEERLAYLEGVDAVFTRERGICIGVSTADCVPILICDQEANVVAAVHAGWRGTVKRIVEKTVVQLCENAGVGPEHLRAVIGPSISLDAFEVGDEVYEAFAEDFSMESISRKIGGKWHIDLWAANYESLLSSGLKLENIRVAGICTHTNHCDFFSARRLGINSGRIFSGIMLK